MVTGMAMRPDIYPDESRCECDLPAKICGFVRSSALIAITFVVACTALTANAESWRVAPSVGVSETFSDNVTQGTSLGKESGRITDVRPEIRVDATGARVKGYFDFSIDRKTYSNQSSLNNSQKSLDSLLSVEAIEGWLYIDFRGAISQQNKSVFGVQNSDLTGAASNRTETRVFQVSPYVKGHIGEIADYQLRFNGTEGKSTDNTLSSTRVSEWVGRVKNAVSGAPIGWSLDASALEIHNNVVSKKTDNRISGTLNYEVLPQLLASIIDGTESTDFAGQGTQNLSTPGIGVEWAPSPRTQVAALEQKRFFGNGHSLLISHRTPLMAWKYSDNKDATALPSALAASGQGAVYALMSDLLAASIPDPLQRADAVRAKLESTGKLASGAPGSGALTSRVVLNRDRQFTIALLGAINTVTVTATQSDQQGIGLGFGTTDSFSLSNELRVQGASVAWTHRLTPLSSLGIVEAYSRNNGVATTNLHSNQRSHSLLYSTLLGPKTTASLGLRSERFNSTLATSSGQKAVVASMVHRF